MNILILGITLKEANIRMDCKTFLQKMALHKNISKTKTINIYLVDTQDKHDSDKQITKTYNQFTFKLHYVNCLWKSLESKLEQLKINKLDMIMNDLSTMKSMKDLASSSFFKSKYITKNTVLMLRDMKSQKTYEWDKFEIKELLDLLAKSDKCHMISSNIVICDMKKYPIKVCENWTGRELKAYIFYLSNENNFWDKTLTEEDIAGLNLSIKGEGVKDNKLLKEYGLLHNSNINIMMISGSKEAWKILRTKFEHNNFICQEFNDTNYIISHPNDKNKSVFYNVCKYKKIKNKKLSPVVKKQPHPNGAKKTRCPNGTRRDKKTGECLPK